MSHNTSDDDNDDDDRLQYQHQQDCSPHEKNDTTTPLDSQSENNIPPKRPRTDPKTLDPIINAGGIHIKTISTALTIKKLQDTIHLLDANTWQLPNIDKKVLYSHLHSSIIRSALRDKVLQRCNQGNIEMFIHAFTTGKSDASTERLIGHPPALNQMSKQRSRDEPARGPQLSLPSTSTLVRTLHQLCTEVAATDLFYSESDFKNFYPQIPLPPQTRRYFGIANIDEEHTRSFYIMRVLVQGWDKSALIAQVVSWTVITNGDNNTTEILKNMENIPGIIIDQQQGAFIMYVLVYDNILVISNSQTLRDEAQRRLQSNCRRWNITLKYLKTTKNEATFCGIELGWANNILTWKIQDSVLQRWKNLCTPTEAPTPKQIAQCFGILSRITHVYLAPPIHLVAVSRAIGNLMRDMHQANHKQWKSPNKSLQPLHRQIILQIEQQQTQATSFGEKMSLENPICIFTDASEKFLGFTITKIDGEKLLEAQRQRTDTRHIDQAEAEAVDFALLSASSIINEGSFDSMIIGIDNQAAGRALLRGASMSPELHAIISACWKHITFDPSIVGICDIPSAENVADVMTRSGDITTVEYHTRKAASMKRACKALESLQLGLRWTARQLINKPNTPSNK
ncbi:unnamed protein product [Bodo saltans]|uniref:Uncharacterized protein n=1 Tax=Bodo saltans TaxID=75058 RepID=A0A0S4IJ91_BODSA|nr:unnamed protein product [Bodo saltans]|eukprot:CUE77229.1 unnamed protein product [Bodo saltans]